MSDWVEKAAAAIMDLTIQLSQKKIGRLSVDEITAIINRHLPPEEKVEKIMEIVKEIADKIEIDGSSLLLLTGEDIDYLSNTMEILKQSY